MNIRSATRQIEGAVRAYLAKDDHGVYLVPLQMQRPIILMGPPGVGKTAVVGQVAERLGINFVSYSITHHTRQSALGLPYIADATYGGRPYKVSRYTMSEIIAATYDAMAESGVEEGILFLDEVNCVSETLAPAMLQFLQYKAFGQHRLPPGWAIVCAGNPPEYNRAARDFDPAMLDRMKRIDVEPDLDVWMGYAVAHGMHPAVTTYLYSKPDNFFRISTTVDGTRMVTARGWEDLSRMLQAYAHEGLSPDRDLVSQYLQDPDVAEDFALYLELFQKYEGDWRVEDVLAGKAGDDTRERARKAPFDERVSLVQLLVSALANHARAEQVSEAALRSVRTDMADAKARIGAGERAEEVFGSVAEAAQSAFVRAQGKGSVSDARQRTLSERAGLLHRIREAVLAGGGWEAARDAYNSELAEVAAQARRVSDEVDAAVAFVEDAFGNGEELLVLCTRLAVDEDFMRFVSTHGADRFVEASHGLMFHDQRRDLLDEVSRLEGEGPVGTTPGA